MSSGTSVITVDDTSAEYPKHKNILLLGEKGVGKSTFINAIVNYLRYDSMNLPLNREVQVVIKTPFTFTDDKGIEDEISFVSTPEERQQGSNEIVMNGQPTTQDPKSHSIPLDIEGEKSSIRIIDTPGIGDTRGLDQDMNNFKKILSYIAETNYSELHAICILLKPDASHATLGFFINEFLLHLPKSASKNILFCFTHTRKTSYKPGKLIRILKKHMGNLQGIDIPLNKSTLFSFDNESFPYLCAKNIGCSFTDRNKKHCNKSWKKSLQETSRLLSRIAELPAHSIEETLCLNSARAVYVTLGRPLERIELQEEINELQIKKNSDEINDYRQELNNLQGKLHLDKVVIHAEEVDCPQTVCTAVGCAEHRPLTADANSPMQIVYQTTCHDLCTDTVKGDICPNPELQKCWAMDEVGNCRICGCSWSTHKLLRNRVKQTAEKVTDATVEARIEFVESSMTALEFASEAAREKIEELNEESEKINDCRDELAAYLVEHSLLTYNKQHTLYIEHLINAELGKGAAGRPAEVGDRAKRYKTAFKQQCALDAVHNVEPVGIHCVDDIKEMWQELDLEHDGSLAEELRDAVFEKKEREL